MNKYRNLERAFRLARAYVKLGGTYRHCDGVHYIATGFSLNVKQQCIDVIYTPAGLCYGKVTFTRTLHEFIGPVSGTNGMMQRFTLVTDKN